MFKNQIKMKISGIKKAIVANSGIIIVLVCSLLFRLAGYFYHLAVWWDSAVYIGMGKYIFSLGQIGLFENFRPIILPLMLGSAWKLGLNPIITGLVLALLFSLGAIYLCYLIGKELFGKKTAIVAAALLSFSPLFFVYNYRILSEIPSVFFALLGVYLFLKRKPFWAGLFAGVSFLTRFPEGLIIVSLGLAIIFRQKKQLFSDIIKQGLVLGAGFLVAVAPYLVFNYIRYGNPILPLILGDIVIKEANAWMYPGTYLFYFTSLFKENCLSIFAIAAIIFALKQKKIRQLLPILFPLLLLFAYFTYLPHKELRFALIFLPYLHLLSAYGIISCIDIFKKKQFRTLCFVVLFVIFGAAAISNAQTVKFDEPRTMFEDFGDYVKQSRITGPVISTSPMLSAYIDNKVICLADWTYADAVYNESASQSNLLLIDSCDFPCSPKDKACWKLQDDFMKRVLKENKVLVNKTTDSCQRYILSHN